MSDWDYYIDYLAHEGVTQDDYSFEEFMDDSRMRAEDDAADAFMAWRRGE